MADSFTIRALVLHHSIDIYNGDLAERVDDTLSKLLAVKDEISGDYNIEIGMVRVTLPNPEPGSGVDVARRLERIVGSHSSAIISVGNISSKDPKLSETVEAVVSNGLFTGILVEKLDWSTAQALSSLIHKISEADPNYAVNIGLNLLGEPIVTPYFPLSYSPGTGDIVTIALTYPNYLADGYKRRGYKGLIENIEAAGRLAEKMAKEAAEKLKAAYGGVDLSVAPWMSETTLGLVELVAGTRMPQPGFSWGLYLVNKALKEAGARLEKTTGFNEAQLPIAEDLKLKARASEGEVRARDLARLAGVCLAGLDLAVVPADVNGIAGLILETGAYSRSKGKPLGLRIIPVEGVEEGDKVYLTRFGETPVINI